MTTLVIGERGEGKTSLALYLAQKRSSVVLVFEPKADESVAMCDFVYSDSELDESLEKAKSDKKALVAFVPTQDTYEGFSEFISVVRSPNPRIGYAFGGVSIVIDEAWCLMNAKTSHPELENLLRLAPRVPPNVINVFVCAHRAADINRRTHFFSDEIFIFRTTEVDELETLEKKWHPSIPHYVSAFPDGEHHAAQYNKNTKALTIWKNPEIWNPNR